MDPTVSLLIPCYNAEQWIIPAIESALNQTYSNIEIIVIDDGSSDRSLEKIKQFGDAIRWETQSNQGGNITRNRLLELSRGTWVQYLDADDYLLPDKIEKQIHFLSQYPDTDVIFSPGIDEFWTNGQSVQQIKTITHINDPWILLAKWELPQTGRVLLKRDGLVAIGGWNEQQPCCQEHELYFRLLADGRNFRYCDHAGSVYRLWSQNTVSRKNPLHVYRERLRIKDRMYTFLQTSEQLTQPRLRAINQSRLDCARIIWNYDQRWATQIISIIHRVDPQFSLTDSPLPALYKALYSTVGFSVAETVAAWKRKLLNRPRTL